MSESTKPSSPVRGRVIAFEGVDGAGKSTVLQLVTEHLRSTGVEVYLPRAGKEHRARPVREIRRMTRDRRNYELSPRAELLLYAAREAQVLEREVQPAIARGATVLLDRSMLTPLVLGVWGRGLELGPAEAICEAASAGMKPDHTLIFDVDPRTSRVRKRLDKARSDRWRDGGRKGMSGSGFKERIRDGYQEIARRDELPVFHAERSGPREVADRVIAYLERGVLDEPAHDRKPHWSVEPGIGFPEAVAGLPDLLQLYFTRGLELGRPIRARLFEREPRLCVWAADFGDPLLERAAEIHPSWVLTRISSAETRGFEATAALADALRERLVDEDPALVARSLAGISTPESDALRERLIAPAPGAVVESLLGRGDALASELRERLWKKADSHERARSLQLVDDAFAWAKREKLLDSDPAVALPSLVGLDPARVDPLIEPYLEYAPKGVLLALRGRGDDHAYDLRERLLETGREVIDSFAGLDDPRAWALRERCAERWPSTVVTSLRGLDSSERARELTARCLRAAPDDLFLIRRLHQLEELAKGANP